MSLPLTLAVLDGMVVTIANETLVIPLTAIVETLQPKPAAVHGFGGDTRVIAIRDHRDRQQPRPAPDRFDHGVRAYRISHGNPGILRRYHVGA